MQTIGIIFKKELRDLLRDRRTIIAMIVIPLLLIPVILTLMAKFSSNSESEPKRNIRIAVHTNGNGEELIRRIKLRKDIDLREDVSPYEFKKMIREDSLDFGLILNENFDDQIKEGETGSLTLFHKYSRRDTISFERFAKTIRDFRRSVIEQRLEMLGTSTHILNPVKIDADNVDNNKTSIGKIVGGILPFFFVLFCLMGAMYPAIDLFTGEKERGTIETLLVLPTNRIKILIGKMGVIVTVGVLSGLFSFVGIWAFLKLNPNLPFMSLLLNANNVGLILMMMVPLTIFLRAY